MRLHGLKAPSSRKQGGVVGGPVLPQMFVLPYAVPHIVQYSTSGYTAVYPTATTLHTSEVTPGIKPPKIPQNSHLNGV